MKRLLLWFVLIVLLLAGAGTFVLTRLDTGFVATTISDAVNKATGAPVTFTDQPRLSLFPLGVDFGRLAWKREGPDRSLTVSAAGGHARVALSPLFSGRIVVEIDYEVFAGRTVTPQTKVRLFGKVDKEMMEPTKVDVKYLEIVK